MAAAAVRIRDPKNEFCSVYTLIVKDGESSELVTFFKDETGYFLITPPGHYDEILFFRKGTDAINIITKTLKQGAEISMAEFDVMLANSSSLEPTITPIAIITRALRNSEMLGQILAKHPSSQIRFQGFSGYFTQMYANLLIEDSISPTRQQPIRFICSDIGEAELEHDQDVGVFGDNGHISAVVMTRGGCYLFDTEGTTHQKRNSTQSSCTV